TRENLYSDGSRCVLFFLEVSLCGLSLVSFFNSVPNCSLLGSIFCFSTLLQLVRFHVGNVFYCIMYTDGTYCTRTRCKLFLFSIYRERAGSNPLWNGGCERCWRRSGRHHCPTPRE